MKTRTIQKAVKRGTPVGAMSFRFPLDVTEEWRALAEARGITLTWFILETMGEALAAQTGRRKLVLRVRK